MSAYTDAQANNDITRNVKQYKDLDLFFSKKSNKDVNKVTDVEAVKRSVRNLLLLNTFEKPFHPEIAGDIRGLLFENMTPLTAAVISRKVEDCVANFEPRVTNVGVKVSANPDDNFISVTVFFEIIGLQLPTQSFTFILEPTR